jgi:hypothetical protein
MLGQIQSAPRSLFDGRPERLVSPAAHSRHELHHPERDWPQTNCYVDLWIELAAAAGFEPKAMLGFTIAQDFEGDQFTFFKPPLADLERLFGLRVEELALYDRVESHVERQIARGRVVLLEVDGYFLPDTRGVTYRLEHSKTTIAIARFDAAASRLEYFHNDGLFTLENDDFDGVLGRLPGQKRADTLFPYAEFVRFDSRRADAGDTREIAEELLRRHFARRPENNPLRSFSVEFPRLWSVMEDRPPGFFHSFAFNSFRQLGANFELLGSHLAWLRGDGFFDAGIAECRLLSSSAKAMQFQVARAASRRRPFDPGAALEDMAGAYDRLFAGLARALTD